MGDDIDVNALIARLDRLESVQEIQELHFRYAECVDRARFTELGELFAHGELSSDVGDGSMKGADQIGSFYAATNKVHADGTLRTRHLATNLIVEVDDDLEHARARSYFVVLQATDAVPLQPIVAGRYHDTFARIDGRWWFEHRRISVDQIGNMSDHLSFDLAAERIDLG